LYGTSAQSWPAKTATGALAVTTDPVRSSAGTGWQKVSPWTVSGSGRAHAAAPPETSWSASPRPSVRAIVSPGAPAGTSLPGRVSARSRTLTSVPSSVATTVTKPAARCQRVCPCWSTRTVGRDTTV
jgi:hypothetical protein